MSADTRIFFFLLTAVLGFWGGVCYSAHRLSSNELQVVVQGGALRESENLLQATRLLDAGKTSQLRAQLLSGIRERVGTAFETRPLPVDWHVIAPGLMHDAFARQQEALQEDQRADMAAKLQALEAAKPPAS